MRRSLRTVLWHCLAAVVVLGSIGSAWAAIYVGKWDPQFGNPYVDLGFRVSVTVDVPGFCDHSAGNWIVQNDGPASTETDCNGLATISAAQVTLYDLGNPGSTKVLDFAPMTLLALQFVGGNLTAISSGPSSWLTSSPFGPSFGDDFLLAFSLDKGPVLSGRHRVCSDDDDKRKKGRIRDGSGSSGGNDEDPDDCRFEIFANHFEQFPPVLEGGSFARVSEPGAGTLAAAAALAWGLIARRRRRPSRSR